MIKAQRVAATVMTWLGKRREGRVHSVFARACNLSWGDDLISLVQPEHGMVPGGITVALREGEGLPFLPGEPVWWDPAAQRLGDLDLAEAEIWENRPPLPKVAGPGVVARRIAEVMNVVRTRGRGDLVRMLAADPTTFPDGGNRLHWSTYAWTPIQELLRAVSFRDEAALAAPLRALIGLGEGLTPSGDDFVLGLLAAMHYSQSPGTGVLAQEVGRLAGTTTPISANYLRLAAGGGFSERLEALVLALLSEDGSDAAAAAQVLIETGHSSGTDSLVGAVLGTIALFTGELPGRAYL